MVVTGSVALTRILTDPLAPSPFVAWFKHAANQHLGALSFLFVDFFLFSGVATLTFLQASQISRNITTNELANAMRYSYLRGPGGRFRNPYDHGCKKNCSDLWIIGYNVDEEFIEEIAEAEGIDMMQMSRNSNEPNGIIGHSHHQPNGNGHVLIDMNNSTKALHGHVHSSSCSHSNNHAKTESVPLGLGLGLGRSSARSVIAL